MEQTQRGEKDREREKEVMEGEPAQAQNGDGGMQPATTTKDKGVEPVRDTKRGQKQS